MYGRLSYLLAAHTRATQATHMRNLRTGKTRPLSSRPTLSRQFSDPSKRRGL